MKRRIIIPGMGKRVASIRNSHSMTQEKVGEALGVTSTQISRIENDYSSGSLAIIKDFCSYFNCSMDYIIFGKENNTALSKLPEEIVNILNMEDSEDLVILLKYLEMFETMRKK